MTDTHTGDVLDGGSNDKAAENRNNADTDNATNTTAHDGNAENINAKSEAEEYEKWMRWQQEQQNQYRAAITSAASTRTHDTLHMWWSRRFTTISIHVCVRVLYRRHCIAESIAIEGDAKEARPT